MNDEMPANSGCTLMTAAVLFAVLISGVLIWLLSEPGPLINASRPTPAANATLSAVPVLAEPIAQNSEVHTNGAPVTNETKTNVDATELLQSLGTNAFPPNPGGTNTPKRLVTIQKGSQQRSFWVTMVRTNGAMLECVAFDNWATHSYPLSEVLSVGKPTLDWTKDFSRTNNLKYLPKERRDK